MNKHLSTLCFGLALGLALPWALFAAQAPADKPAAATQTAKAPAIQVGTTLENITSTFIDESNAQAQYLAYAQKADAEGYHKVAGLFRATAMAQGLHAKGHAEAIKSMGGVAKAVPAKPTVGSTKENLEAALKAENHKISALFPAYLEKAVADKNIKAQHIFEGLKAVEGVHSQLYAAALANLESWKAKSDFFVCKVCGNVVEKLSFEYCPICKAPISEFVKVQ